MEKSEKCLLRVGVEQRNMKGILIIMEELGLPL